MNRLHFGCFNCPTDGWLNTDVTPHLWIARIPGLARVMTIAGVISEVRFGEHQRGVFKRVQYQNVVRPWRYRDDQFEAIYSSHVLEHLPLKGSIFCLSEGFRCLKTGGILRIAVPDLDAAIRNYQTTSSLQWAIDFFEANERHEKNQHHFMFSFNSLRSLLNSAGFTEVTLHKFCEGDCPDLDKLDNRPESLFVEARK